MKKLDHRSERETIGRQHGGLEVAPKAANDHSLVGATFGEYPETTLVKWLRKSPITTVRGIDVREFDLCHEWATLQSRIARRRWYPTLESDNQKRPLFPVRTESIPSVLPDAPASNFAH